jgi:hypothetical protein
VAAARLASSAVALARSASSAARRACLAASIAASPTTFTACSEARAIASASSIRSSISLSSGGAAPSGSSQSWVLSRSVASMTPQFTASAGGKRAELQMAAFE